MMRATVAAVCALVSCTSANATPFLAPVPSVTADLGTVVIEWLASSCDEPGYIVVATNDGRFVGTVHHGSTLVAAMPVGEYDLLAWNPLVEAESVPVRFHVVRSHARICANRATRMHVDYAAWRARRTGSKYCSRDWVIAPGVSGESPPSHGADIVSGRHWLLSYGGFPLHRELGQRWYDAVPAQNRALVSAECSGEPARP
jgi:hypothetical protein